MRSLGRLRGRRRWNGVGMKAGIGYIEDGGGNVPGVLGGKDDVIVHQVVFLAVI